jgi:hypothetical protein
MFDWMSQAKIFEAGHAVEWISGATGAAGAIVGAAVSVAWTEFFNRRARKRDLKVRNHAAAFAVWNKLIKIYSSSMSIKRHYSENEKEYNPDNGPRCLQGRPGYFDQTLVQLTIDERMTVWTVSGAAALNRLLDLDDQYNFLVQAVTRYLEHRQALFDSLTPVAVDGAIGTISEEDQRRIAPKVVELDMELSQSFGMAASIVQSAFEALRDLAHSRGRPFGKSFEFATLTPAGEKIKFSAKDAAKPLRRWFEFWRWFEPPAAQVDLDDRQTNPKLEPPTSGAADVG